MEYADKFGADRLDAACKRALEINAHSYSSVHSILKNGIDRKPRTRATPKPLPRRGLPSPTQTSVAPITSTDRERILSMLTHPTHDRLKALRLDGMAEAFAELQTQDRAADLTHAEWLGLLADREEASRETKRYDTRMHAARLRHLGACPEDVD